MIGGDPSFAELERAVDASLAARTLQRGRDVIGIAASRSRILRRLREHGRLAWSQPVSERLRLLGLALVAFSIANLILASIVPPASAPAFPAFVWGTTAFVGAGLLSLSRRTIVAQKKNP